MGPLRAMRGAWNLLLLGFATRFRLRGGYWAWRRETGFGTDPSRMPGPRERRRAMLEYGEWVGQMRAMRK